MVQRFQSPPSKHDPVRIGPSALDDLRSPMCGSAFRKLVAPPSRSSKKANQANLKSSERISSDQQSLLVGSGSIGPGKTRNNSKINPSEGRRARSPSADSTSSGANKSPKGAANKRSGFFASVKKPSSKDGDKNEVAPYLMLQFSPSEESESPIKRPQEAEKRQERNSVTENDKPQSTTKTTRSNTSQSSTKPPPRQTSQSNEKSNARTVPAPSWSSSLASVAEESRDDASSHAEVNTSADMMVAMKTLMHKQQNSMKEMERENRRVREELAEYRKLLAEATTSRTQEEGLTEEKNRAESEAKWLREEMRAMKAEMERIKEVQVLASPVAREAHVSAIENKSPDRRNERFQETRGDTKYSHHPERNSQRTSELVEFKEIKKEMMSNKQIYGDILDEADSLLKSDSDDTFSEAFPKDQDEESTYDTSTTSSGNGENLATHPEYGYYSHASSHTRSHSSHRNPLSAHNYGHPQYDYFHEQQDHEDHYDRREAEFSQSSRSMRSVEGDSVSISSASRSKEEVNLFKNRLQEIQKKRELRKQREGDYGSRSGRVRFD